MDRYVVFRNNKRVSLKEDDMSAEKLSRIFQVSTQSLYMTDDANVAIFPGSSGHFSSYELTPRAHYEIHGEKDTSQATASSGRRFTFMRTPATTSSTAQRTPPQKKKKDTVSKTFQRSIFLAEVVGGRLSPSRMVVIQLLESEATLQGIIGKVQDAIGSHDPMVLTDAQGNAILESEGTTEFIEEPVFTQCCRSIIGCKTCVEQWQETSVYCAKCRGNTTGNNIFEVNGLSEAFSVLRSLFEEE